MNQELTQTQPSSIKSVRRNCPKCGWIRDTADTKCADCGKPLQSVATIRGIGVFLVILGAALIGVMSWLSLWVYKAINEVPKPGSSPRFTGDHEDIGFIAFAFGLVLVIGLTSVVGGLWQIVFGKRNKLIMALAAVLGLIFLGLGLWASVNR